MRGGVMFESNEVKDEKATPLRLTPHALPS